MDVHKRRTCTRKPVAAADAPSCNVQRKESGHHTGEMEKPCKVRKKETNTEEMAKQDQT